MKTLSRVKSYTKEGYKDAIIEALDDLKSRVDDILCDYNKGIKSIEISLKVEPGCVSLLNITKTMNVEVDNDKRRNNYDSKENTFLLL